MSGVDVIVPCYNYARFLPRCITSILDQQGVNVRVLIIDDASSDDTPEVGQRLAALDARVEFRLHQLNCGHIATYNEGLLGWASAKYSLLLSADDMLAPGALARATRLMDRHSDVGMTYGMALFIERDPEPLATTEPDLEDCQVISGPRYIERVCRAGNAVPTPTAVVRTELQQRLGGYRPDLPHSGDMEMWLRFAAHAPIGVLRSVQAYYRMHGSNMSSQFYAGLISDRREQLQACTEVFTRWGQTIPEWAYWLQGMSKRLAEEVLWIGSNAFDDGDADVCKSCVELAEELYPGLGRSRRWWRLRAKRFLGPGLWRRILPWLMRIRGVGHTLSEPIKMPIASRHGLQIGWWPKVA